MAQLEKAGVNPEALSALDEEHTKFFGGDASLSHLVKGLDYALLQRVRRGRGQHRGGIPLLLRGAGCSMQEQE
jgi:hypothetical protein